MTDQKSGSDRGTVSGSAKELGRQMKLGIDAAFNRVNEAGGVEGRMLKLIAADDGYEPARTGDAMKQLYEKTRFSVSLEMLEHRPRWSRCHMRSSGRCCFFGAFTGANVLRHDPPDRYVFNYRRATPRKPTPWCATW